MLFQCLTGANPFTAENALAVMYLHLTNEPPKPSEVRPGVPAGFGRVIAQGMAKDPELRFANAGDLASAARRVLTDRGTKQMPVVAPEIPSAAVVAAEPARPRRQGRLAVAAAVVVAVALGVAAVIWSQSGRTQETGQSAPSSPTAIDNPACDGRYIVIVGSAVNPAAYAKDVQKFLDLNPGAKYLHAPTTGCRSLRTHVNTAEIYSVFYGPFPDENKARGHRATVGGDSFVRRLDSTSTPERAVSCR
jgi:serine/threonine-protein kinase